MFKRWRRVFLAMGGIGSLLGLTVALLVTWRMARVYKSSRQPAAMHELGKAISDQDQVVAEKRSTLDSIKEVIDRNDGGPNQDFLLHLKYSAVDYIDAKRDLETETERLQTLLLKQRAGAIESIVIHSNPESPVSPNVWLNLALGTASGLLLSPLLALALIPVLKRVRR